MQNIHAFRARSCDVAGVTAVKVQPRQCALFDTKTFAHDIDKLDGATSGRGDDRPLSRFPIDAGLLPGARAAAGLAAHVIGVTATGARSLLALAVGGLVLHVR